MNVRILLVIAVYLFSAQSAWCATPEDKEIARVKARVKKTTDGFYTVRYATYTVKTDIDRQFAAEAAVYMRKFQAAFRSFFKPKPKLKIRPTLYIFKDRATYKKAMTARGYKDLAAAGGGYAATWKRSELYCFHNKPGKSFGRMNKEPIRHEGAHQLLNHALGRHDVPIWFTEGVATFFEDWDLGKPRKWNIDKLQKGHSLFGWIKKSFGTDTFKDLNHLVRLIHETWRPDKNAKDLVMQHYAEAQSFMTFLLVNPKGREFFSHIFRAVARGRDVSKMLTPKTISRAQDAWYKDIRERIARASNIKYD